MHNWKETQLHALWQKLADTPITPACTLAANITVLEQTWFNFHRVAFEFQNFQINSPKLSTTATLKFFFSSFYVPQLKKTNQ
jgi:hypothetical protein